MSPLHSVCIQKKPLSIKAAQHDPWKLISQSQYNNNTHFIMKTKYNRLCSLHNLQALTRSFYGVQLSWHHVTTNLPTSTSDCLSLCGLARIYILLGQALFADVWTQDDCPFSPAHRHEHETFWLNKHPNGLQKAEDRFVNQNQHVASHHASLLLSLLLKLKLVHTYICIHFESNAVATRVITMKGFMIEVAIKDRHCISCSYKWTHLHFNKSSHNRDLWNRSWGRI